MAKKKEDTIGAFFGGIIVLAFLFSWLAIPENNRMANGFEIASLTFANGVFSGWADDIAIHLFHSNYHHEKEAATAAFRNAILWGEQHHLLVTVIFNLIGAFASIGGVVAVWLARFAGSTKQAFQFGFWAEIAEAFAFHLGYKTTVGHWAVSQEEVGITLIVAVIMGLFAIRINKGASKSLPMKTA